MKCFLVCFIVLFSLPVFSKTSIEDKCRNASFEVQKKKKACKPFISSFYKTRDPVFNEKTFSSVVVKAKINEGAVKTLEGSLGYDFDPFEFGLLIGSLETKESSFVGKVEGNYGGAYLQYNFLKRSLALNRGYNAFMTASLGSSTLDVYELEETNSYPYVGIGAGGVYYLGKNIGITAGVNLHHIIHQEKNLFHLGSSFSLGLEFKF